MKLRIWKAVSIFKNLKQIVIWMVTISMIVIQSILINPFKNNKQTINKIKMVNNFIPVLNNKFNIMLII